MSAAFTDHFATVASHYADHRPTYPAALFDWLANQCESRDLAWDCGAGSGQASVELAGRFARVVATDASAAQLRQAVPHPRVEYRVAPAEAGGLESGVADLVTVAQALHWFDLDRFYAESRRALKPAGVIAAWSYGIPAVEGEAVDSLVQRFYHDTVGPYWPPERRHVETGYRDLPFPFERIAAPSFAMTVRWNLDQLLGYFHSWSATVGFVKAKGFDPVAEVEKPLRERWGEAGTPRGWGGRWRC